MLVIALTLDVSSLWSNVVAVSDRRGLSSLSVGRSPKSWLIRLTRQSLDSTGLAKVMCPYYFKDSKGCVFHCNQSFLVFALICMIISMVAWFKKQASHAAFLTKRNTDFENLANPQDFNITLLIYQVIYLRNHPSMHPLSTLFHFKDFLRATHGRFYCAFCVNWCMKVQIWPRRVKCIVCG